MLNELETELLDRLHGIHISNYSRLKKYVMKKTGAPVSSERSYSAKVDELLKVFRKHRRSVYNIMDVLHNGDLIFRTHMRSAGIRIRFLASGTSSPCDILKIKDDFSRDPIVEKCVKELAERAIRLHKSV